MKQTLIVNEHSKHFDKYINLMEDIFSYLLGSMSKVDLYTRFAQMAISFFLSLSLYLLLQIKAFNKIVTLKILNIAQKGKLLQVSEYKIKVDFPD